MRELQEPGLTFKLGFPIRVRFSFALALGLGALVTPGWAERLAVVLCAGVGALVHELGHAWMARAVGVEPTVALHALGGTTSWPPEAPLPRGQRALIALGGPIASLALGGVALLFDFALAPWESPLHALWSPLRRASFGWGLVNLLPVFPFDGGALVTAAFGQRYFPRRRLTALVAGGSALLWGGLAVGMRFEPWVSVLLGLFALSAGSTTARSLARRLAPGIRIPGLPENSRLHTAQVLVHQGHGERGVQLVRGVLATRPSAAVQARALELLVQGLCGLRDGQGALEALLDFPRDQVASRAARASALLASGWADVALELLEAKAPGEGDPHAAHVLLLALLEQGRLDEAIARAPGLLADGCCAEALLDVARAAARAGRWEACAALCVAGFARGPGAALAYEACRALSRLGRAEEAVAWFSRAVEAGFAADRLLEVDPELGAIRELPDFIAARARFAPPEPRQDFTGWSLPPSGSQAGLERPGVPAPAPESLPERLPILPLRHAALLPTEISLAVAVDGACANAVYAARAGEGLLGVMSHQTFAREPEPVDLLEVGVVARVLRVARLGPEGLVVELEGLSRFRAERFVPGQRYLSAGVEPLGEGTVAPSAAELGELRQAAAALLPALAEAPLHSAERIASARGRGPLADAVAVALDPPLHQKLSVLRAVEGSERVRLVRELLARRAKEVRAIPAARCPCCDWIPPPEARWRCGCGRAFNTFEAHGHCPGCGHRLDVTPCPRCEQPSGHEAWSADAARRGWRPR